MRNKIVSVLSLISLTIILAMMNFTTPTAAGPFGVLVFFVAVYLFVLGIVTAVARLFKRIFGKSKSLNDKDYLYVAVISFGPIILLLLQSFGTVNIGTMILTVFFVGLACFLINKRS